MWHIEPLLKTCTLEIGLFTTPSILRIVVDYELVEALTTVAEKGVKKHNKHERPRLSFPLGVVIGSILMVYSVYVAKKKNYPLGGEFSLRNIWHHFKIAFFGLLTPIIILGGIFSDFFTPSECAVIAVDYAIFVALFVYRDINLKQLYSVIVTPVFLPIVDQLCINLIHFGIVIVMGLTIGMITPPLAINLYVTGSIS